ncbi:MAG: hypothetical protein JWM04_1590 [Verrucomicrobiales bacterium]|nr:hypothetical protein [Verrucomicrobiales bacterium]
MATANVGEAADGAYDFSELVRAMPGDGESADGA